MMAFGKILMVLDVDGTVSRLYGDAEREMHRALQRDAPYLPLDETVIDSLDLQTQRPGVIVGWLTSWAKSQADVDELVHGSQLRGRLGGELVPWSANDRHGRRKRSLLEHLERTLPDAVIWVDDEAPRDTHLRIWDRVHRPALVIRPRASTGITHSDVDRIREFITAQGEGFDAAGYAAAMDRDRRRPFLSRANL